MKALRNFMCNGLSIQRGQSLTSEDMDKIGDQFQSLVALGCIEVSELEQEPVITDVVSEPEVVETPKKKKKKEV